MHVGYARVSTHEQHLDLQTDALKKADCEKIFIDKVSGVAAKRPRLDDVMEFLRPGNTLIVWRLDRVGRSLKHLIEFMERLQERKIGFRSLQESLDTTTAEGMLVFHIFAALVEFERSLLQERTHAGLAAARARGRKGTRPTALDDLAKHVAIKLYYEREYSVKDICQMMNISRSTLYSYVHQDGWVLIYVIVYNRDEVGVYWHFRGVGRKFP